MRFFAGGNGLILCLFSGRNILTATPLGLFQPLLGMLSFRLQQAHCNKESDHSTEDYASEKI